MITSIISVQNLTKSFGNHIVVQNLSFDIQKGEVFGLLGHNGAGKSTTIDMILGLKKPDQGKALIFGLNAMENRKQVFEKVGVQLQNTSYPSAMKVEEACIEYASLYEYPLDYESLLEQFHLMHAKQQFISKLSAGQKQKLSIILALIGNPQIVFLDELTTGLDVVSRREVWHVLKKLKENGLTIFLTTHYMEEAQALCDRLCLIRNGIKIIEGSVQDIIKQAKKSNLEEAYLYYMDKENGI
ncbi:ABC transporter ATP-binding protein [Floccifex sp.]|uniref:ABC transporter ATP-binding protein n=1 Tax=Floccifex sp. TaxID=2815810 RepID=UPI003F0B74B7